jgi:hypothetical protein
MIDDDLGRTACDAIEPPGFAALRAVQVREASALLCLDASRSHVLSSAQSGARTRTAITDVTSRLFSLLADMVAQLPSSHLASFRPPTSMSREMHVAFTELP